MTQITVFYDGKCDLCAKEINHYRRIAPDGVFNFQDITEDASALERTGVSYVEGLRLLHTLDADGHLHVGVDAFVLMWRQMKRWRVLAFFVSLPPIKQLVGLVYRAFANWRFKRLAHCQIAEN